MRRFMLLSVILYYYLLGLRLDGVHDGGGQLVTLAATAAAAVVVASSTYTALFARCKLCCNVEHFWFWYGTPASQQREILRW